MDKLLVSIPYIYPLCPLNFNHAKMFVVADVLCRYKTSKGKKVIFPVASHYSGNTAQKTSASLKKLFNQQGTNIDSSNLRLHRNKYRTPVKVLKSFIDPENLLNYYTQEIFWELKSLNLSSEFKHYYATNHKDFPVFVNSIFDVYEKKHLVIRNKKGDLALDYDNPNWKKATEKLIKKTKFNQEFHKKNILAAINNIRNNWGFLRKNGFGVRYKKKWIIDPMFDSELFTIFDLYVLFKDTIKESSDVKLFFKLLFRHIETGKTAKNPLINKILNHLPCDVFVCEEHLKNWVVKKFYAESILLHPKYRTKKYMVMGMSLLNGKRMSASRGHTIFSKDLIEKYGSHTARLTMLLSGGNISKNCKYNKNLSFTANKFLINFRSYFIQLIAQCVNKKTENIKLQSNSLKSQSRQIDLLIESENYRQAITELLVIMPKKYNTQSQLTTDLLSYYLKYLAIFLPRFTEDFI